MRAELRVHPLADETALADGDWTAGLPARTLPLAFRPTNMFLMAHLMMPESVSTGGRRAVVDLFLAGAAEPRRRRWTRATRHDSLPGRRRPRRTRWRRWPRGRAGHWPPMNGASPAAVLPRDPDLRHPGRSEGLLIQSLIAAGEAFYAAGIHLLRRRPRGNGRTPSTPSARSPPSRA